MRRRALIEFIALILVVAGIDQASKMIVMRAMAFGESIPVLPPVLWLTPWKNTGMAFGLLSGANAVVGVLAALTALFLLLYNRGQWQTSRLVRVGLGMLLGGAIGNLIDRARLGYVVDFLELPYWPVFNFADSCIVIGGVLLAWSALRPKASRESRV
jgi:signal peptidase II